MTACCVSFVKAACGIHNHLKAQVAFTPLSRKWEAQAANLLPVEYPIALRCGIKGTQSYMFYLYWEKKAGPPETSVDLLSMENVPY